MKINLQGRVGFLGDWVYGWMGGWMDGYKSWFKDYLQQSKIILEPGRGLLFKIRVTFIGLFLSTFNLQKV